MPAATPMTAAMIVHWRTTLACWNASADSRGQRSVMNSHRVTLITVAYFGGPGKATKVGPLSR
jgi:hypothetical protein